MKIKKEVVYNIFIVFFAFEEKDQVAISATAPCVTS